MTTRPLDDSLLAEPGAYLLVVELTAPLLPGIATLPDAVLVPGRYAYCGSAYGPGGLKARIGRHLRKDKALRWHVDRLTAVGRVVSVHAEPGGDECDLVTRVLETPGASVPVPSFGSTDCGHCPAHLVALPRSADLDAMFAMPRRSRPLAKIPG